LKVPCPVCGVELEPGNKMKCNNKKCEKRGK